MKAISRIILPVIFITSTLIGNSVALADDDAKPVTSASDIIIISSSDQSAQFLLTSTENGVKHYARIFDLTVYNSTDKVLSLATKSGCFKAENETASISIVQKVVDPDLLKELPAKSESRGYIIFSSKDNSVMDTKFVTWSSGCHK